MQIFKHIWLATQISLNRKTGKLMSSFLAKGTHMRLCKTEPPCESHSVELFFAKLFEKVLALYLVCGQSQDTQLAGSFKRSCIRETLTLPTDANRSTNKKEEKIKKKSLFSDVTSFFFVLFL